MNGIRYVDDGWIEEDCNTPRFVMTPHGNVCLMPGVGTLEGGGEGFAGALVLTVEETNALRSFLVKARRPRRLVEEWQGLLDLATLGQAVGEGEGT